MSSTPPPKNLQTYIASAPLQLAVAIISGLILLVFASGIESVLVGTFGVYLMLSFVSHQFLAQKPHPDVSDRAEDQAGLTSSITSSHRSAYAISSNWISLWQGSTFRYYLHLDATMSLVAYSASHYSPLERYSTDQADQQKFHDEGLDLAAKIAKDTYPRFKHRLRLLIYPEWVYDNHSTEILHLIKSHSAARIPCIPLIAEKLYECFTPQEKRHMELLTGELDQGVLDKLPTLSPASNWRSTRYIKKGKTLKYWPPLFPDMLLIDSALTIPTSAVWWYSSNGHVENGGPSDDRLRKADVAFSTICRYIGQAKWSNYGPGSVGGVALSSTPDTLYSEAFFATPFYDQWLQWIEQNAGRNTAAKQLKDWLDKEARAITRFVDGYLADRRNNGKEIEILDVGCGFGRHLIDLLKAKPGLAGMGIDINNRMVTEASRGAKQAGLHRRAHFMVDDAAELTCCSQGEFDIAICTTNTLGNLSDPKRTALFARLKDIVFPGGQVLVSVYSPASTEPRLESYRAIHLHPEEEGQRIVTTEGLESETFTEASIRALFYGADFAVLRSEPLGDLGFIMIGERRPSEIHQHSATTKIHHSDSVS